MARRLLPLLVGAILILTPAIAAAEDEYRQEFREDAMVSGTSGWARTYAGLYWTDDGGASWRNISPPSAHPARLQAVDFADPEHGWAVEEGGEEPHPRPALFATSDGGRTWARTSIRLPSRYAQVGDASFSAVGAHLVYALVRESRNTAFSIGYLYVSHDGGMHWHELPQRPPHAGELVFTSARDGWIAEEGPEPAVYRTGDGGRHWTEVRLPRPPGLAKARTDYLAPRFEADGHGILAATYDDYERRAVTVLYSTTDFGRHWKLAAAARLIVKGDPVVFAYRGDDSVLTAIYEAPQLGLLGVDGSTSPLAGAGLPTEYSPWLSFSGDEDGFGRIETERCDVTAKRARCKDVNELYFTADGGATWTPTSRP
ncbi:MAG TPA: hypothetical protein VGC32_21930 [Solirubrobacterales bacterium]